MIQLEHLHIEDFRRIRVLDLPLGSKSFAVHGPNGSGKSGVVDAIDSALSGSIHRLSGAGTGGVTLYLSRARTFTNVMIPAPRSSN